MPPTSSSRNVAASLVATITGNLYGLFGTIFFGFATGICGLFLPRGRVFFRMGRGWGRSILWSGGIRFSSRFEEDLTDVGRCILMPNHQSVYDIPLLLATLPGETRFLAKESLFRIPVFGWALRTGGFIPVRRGDRRKAREAFLSAIEGLGEGVSILIFPEETRTLDGDLLPFKRGGFLMALRSELPVVPVGIRGNFDVRPKGRFVIHPRKVEVHYGRPLDPLDYGIHDMKRFVADVRAEVRRLADIEGA